MRVYTAWATSAARLASRPLPYVLLDEVDKYPATAGRKEAGPVDLARKRTRTFGHMRKIIRVSTPTIEAGPIWRALNEECEAVFIYWVKCPFCEAWQQIEFKAIKWTGRRRRRSPADHGGPAFHLVRVRGCGKPWDDARRDEAVAAGEWRDRETGIKLETYLTSRRPVVLGFHYRATISRFVPLREAASAFLRSKDDPIKLRDFKNDYEAEPWRFQRRSETTDKIMSLIEDRPRGVVPGGGAVVALTAGVDTQDDGFWFWVHAWGFEHAAGQRPTSWCVRAGFVLDLAAVEEVLWQDHYTDETGRRYIVALTLQDALGHRTAEVYDFCRMRPGKIFPSYGRERMASPYSFSDQQRSPRPGQRLRGALRAVNVNTTYFKNEVAGALAVALGDPGGIRLYDEFPREYAAHLVAEYVNDEGRWECPPGRANHLWDCLALSFAAAEIYGVRHKGPPRTDAQPSPQQQPAQGRRARRAGSWMGDISAFNVE